MSNIVNNILIIVFIALLSLFGYKHFSKNEVVKVAIQDKFHKKSFSETELQNIIKEYLHTHPQEILSALSKLQNTANNNFENENVAKYINKNINDIQTAGYPPILGNIEGKKTIVIFFDYNCSYCKTADKYLHEFVESDKDVKVILRPIAIMGKKSLEIAKLTLAFYKVAEEKYTEFHKQVMMLDDLSVENIYQIIDSMKVDRKIIDNEVSSISVQKSLNRNFEFAKHLQIKGVPSYVINKEFISGVITLDQLKELTKIKQK